MECSFCGKLVDEIEILISGPNVYICNECVDLCVEVLKDQRWLKYTRQLREEIYAEMELDH